MGQEEGLRRWKVEAENTGGWVRVAGRPDTRCSPAGRCVGPAASRRGDQPQPAPWNASNTTDTAVPAEF